MAKEKKTEPTAAASVAKGVAVTQTVNALNAAIDAARKRLQKRRNLSPKEKEEAIVLHDNTVMERTVTKCDRKDIRDEKKVRRMIRRKFRRSRFMRRYHILMRFADRQLIKLAARLNMRKSQIRWNKRIEHHTTYINRINKRLGDLEAVTVDAVLSLPEIRNKEVKKEEKRVLEARVKEESTLPDSQGAPATA